MIGATGRGALLVVAMALVAAPGCMLLLNDGGYSTAGAAAGDDATAGGAEAGAPDATCVGIGATACLPQGADADAAPSPDADASPSAPGSDAAGSTASDAGAEAGTAGDAANAFSCAINATDTACDRCKKNACCTAYQACFADSNCSALYACEQSCVAPPCPCADAFPQGASLYAGVVSCVETSCATCIALGIGDPCITVTNCPSNTACAGWCTPTSCESSLAQCEGSERSTTSSMTSNIFGQENACLRTSSGVAVCFPGCTVSADCAAFPGTVCAPATSVENRVVTACVILPDAGPDQ